MRKFLAFMILFSSTTVFAKSDIIVSFDKDSYQAGETIKVEVKLKDQKYFDYGLISFQGSSDSNSWGSLNFNEKTQRYEAKIRVPKYASAKVPKLEIYLKSKTENSTTLVSGKDFLSPVITGVSRVKKNPVIKQVVVKKAEAADTFDLTYQVSSQSPLAKNSVIAFSSGGSVVALGSVPKCKKDNAGLRCSSQITIPSSVTDLQNIAIIVKDMADKLTVAYSGTDFHADGVVRTAQKPMKVSDVAFLSCPGSKAVTVKLRYEGPSDATGSVSVMGGDISVLSDAKFACDAGGQCQAQLPLPETKNTSKPGVFISFSSESGESAAFLAENHGIDFSAIPLSQEYCKVKNIRIKKVDGNKDGRTLAAESGTAEVEAFQPQ